MVEVSDLAVGILAVVIAGGIGLSSGYCARWLHEAQEERLRRSPLKEMRLTMSWPLKGERARLRFLRAWLLLVGAMFAVVGIELISRGT